MKKNTILILAFLALVALPVMGMAAVSAPTSPGAIEFTLGGYVKFETAWDSQNSQNNNFANTDPRSNDPNFNHGRLRFTANSTRLNVTLKGPKLWGAQVTGFVEVAFDAGGGTQTQGSDTLTTGNLRLRHAMFRFNWPETELLLGQYWGYFSEFTPETANDSGCHFVGSPTQRLPQIRLTQNFLGSWQVSGFVGMPYLRSGTDAVTIAAGPGFTPGAIVAAPANTNNTAGENAESPQIQAKIKFEQDLWGKAAFYGVPRGFTAQVSAGWQRTRWRAGQIAGTAYGTFGQNMIVTNTNAINIPHTQNTNQWILMGSVFIPVIPTYSANLAGTASISAQWYVGQGIDVFGEGLGNQTFFSSLGGTSLGVINNYERIELPRYGGFVQGQYYFNNQWFINLCYGMNRAFGVDQNGPYDNGAIAGRVRVPYTTVFNGTADPYKLWQEAYITLWYRPIQALKFGIQYSYSRTTWFQNTGATLTAAPATAAYGSSDSQVGQDHRLMFAGFFYF